MPLLEVSHLAVTFRTRRGSVRALRDVSLKLDRGETLGIVGESGSGKSVTCTAVAGLLPRSASVESGSIVFDGSELAGAPEAVFRGIRGRRLGMVFQDPMSALNPYLRVSTQLVEALRRHKGMKKGEAREAAALELEAVGLPDARRRLDCYPHEFSGGQRQRILIAMALLLRPDLLIADEPTTALDVTVQAQILELLRERQKQLGTAVVMITHNLGVAAALCDRILVMYAGRVMEEGSVEAVLNRPSHPYTVALKRSIPSGAAGGELPSIPGAPPRAGEALPGCPFAPRCIHAVASCSEAVQALAPVEPGHGCACGRITGEKIRI